MARQGGAAALEFALVLTVFLLVFAGIVSLGGIMWAQQILTAAAAEGARAVVDSGQRGAPDPAAGCVVAKEAATWMNINCAAVPQACAWQSASGGATQCVVVNLSYSTGDWPLLASMNTLASLLNGSSWVPASLTARATVQIQESS